MIKNFFQALRKVFDKWDWKIYLACLILTMINPNCFAIIFMLVSIIFPIFSNNAGICIPMILLNVIFALEFTVLSLPTMPGIIFRLVIFIILVFALFLQLIHMCALASKYKVNEVPSKGTILTKFLLFLFGLIDWIAFKLSRILPLISYAVLTFTIIVGFANIYSSQNDFFKSENMGDGYYHTIQNHDSSPTTVRIPSITENDDIDSFVDNLYFSTVTFYTVGYGDTEIYGAIPKISVQLEMIISNILLVIFLPLSFRYLTNPPSGSSEPET